MDAALCAAHAYVGCATRGGLHFNPTLIEIFIDILLNVMKIR